MAIDAKEARARLEARRRELSDLDAAMAGTDRQLIANLSHTLDEVTAPFAQRRIERDLTRALQGRDALDVADNLGIH